MRRRRGDVAENKCDVTIGEYIEVVRQKEPPAACDDRELRRGASHDRRRNHGA